MQKYEIIEREEELKLKVAKDLFSSYDCTKIIKDIDFCVSLQENLLIPYSFLWAEAKTKNKNIKHAIAQLVLTIGKHNLYSDPRYAMPIFLGAFNAKQIVFMDSLCFDELWGLNDFNWQVTPSDHKSKEFIKITELIDRFYSQNAFIFDYEADSKELKKFIKERFSTSAKNGKTQITKHSLINVFNKWLSQVAPSIDVDWEQAKQKGLLMGDCFLADLISDKNKTITDKLNVVLEYHHYVLDRTSNYGRASVFTTIDFKDKQKAHNEFWQIYRRPPKKELWDDFISRRDLLVPSDIRERKGAFFTPAIWANKAHTYLIDALLHLNDSSLNSSPLDYYAYNDRLFVELTPPPQALQDYYIWDLCAGTGNLLKDLSKKGFKASNIYASTLDKADVDVMHSLIEQNELDLVHRHCFGFDFLNGDFKDLPQSLQEIINDDEKRKKLIILINPPYAEATNAKTPTKTGNSKAKVARDNKTYEKYSTILGGAANEIFAQFFMRIYKELPNCILASFSKLKYVNASNFIAFRKIFKAKFLGGFMVPASSFDNVKGKFPIGFLLWDTSDKQKIESVKIDVFSNANKFLQTKSFYANQKRFISKWISEYYDKNETDKKAHLILSGTDMQSSKGVYLTLQPTPNTFIKHMQAFITAKNLLNVCVFLAVRHAIEATWINDRDQFLYPKSTWQSDIEFINDCLIFAMLHNQNRVSSKQGINHFIPFSFDEIKPKERLASTFLSDFIKNRPVIFRAQALDAYNAGLELFKYYHSVCGDNQNASLYDIKEHFAGRDSSGKLNPPQKASDLAYIALYNDLKLALDALAKKIEPKIYTHGFLLS